MDMQKTETEYLYGKYLQEHHNAINSDICVNVWGPAFKKGGMTMYISCKYMMIKLIRTTCTSVVEGF